MTTLKLLSAHEQVATYLREGAQVGRWGKLMPGVSRLALDLGVNHKTVEAALRQLEREGLLLGRGPGRKRLIVQEGESTSPRPIKVGILLYEAADRQSDYMVELEHVLAEAGHVVVVCSRYLCELKNNLPKISRLARQVEADAWVVLGGAREVLEWFKNQPAPVFALFGRRESLEIATAGPDKPPAYAEATRHLLALGHQRVSMLVRSLRRKPKPGPCEQAFLDELKAAGIETGSFNLPDWEETTPGFHDLLDRLFQVTPPTALIVDEAPMFIATMQYLAVRGMRVPQDVSLICSDPSPAFDWCTPSVAHVRWDSKPLALRVLRWVANVARGRADLRQTYYPADYVHGGTVGPCPVKNRPAGAGF